MILAIRDLLIEKGHLTADQVRRGLETLDSWEPSRGAQIVARAWIDPAFKQRLLADGNAAIAEFGINMGDAKLTVVENSDTVQNVIVCTLCSCYPRAVLGLPPDWYRSKSYRSRVVVEPREVLKDLGTELPNDMTIRVHTTASPTCVYLVMPAPAVRHRRLERGPTRGNRIARLHGRRRQPEGLALKAPRAVPRSAAASSRP